MLLITVEPHFSAKWSPFLVESQRPDIRSGWLAMP